MTIRRRHPASAHADRDAVLSELRDALSRMPECDRTAKLRGILCRIEAEIADGGDAAGVIRRLGAGAEEALAHDPIVRFARATRRLVKTTGLMRARAPDRDRLERSGDVDE